MPIKNAICPNCGATIEVDDGAKAAVCKYCGSPYVVEEAIEQYNIKNQTVTNQEVKGESHIASQTVMNQTVVIHEIEYVTKTVKIPPEAEEKTVDKMSLFGWTIKSRSERVVRTEKDTNGNVTRQITEVTLLMQRRKDLDTNGELSELETKWYALLNNIKASSGMTSSQKFVMWSVIGIVVGCILSGCAIPLFFNQEGSIAMPIVLIVIGVALIGLGIFGIVRKAKNIKGETQARGSKVADLNAEKAAMLKRINEIVKK